MRILVCGGRDFDNYIAVNNAIVQLHMHGIYVNQKDIEIISGMARGADSLAAKFARKHGLKLHAFPANWDKYGNSAGPIRNQQMIDEGKPDLVLAFPGGRGTADMKRRARNHKIRVIEIEATN